MKCGFSALIALQACASHEAASEISATPTRESYVCDVDYEKYSDGRNLTRMMQQADGDDSKRSALLAKENEL